MLGFTVASALVGTVLGSMFAGAPSDRYGRRQCLQALAVLYVITALGCAVAWDWYSFVFFRFIGGLAIGGSSVIGPMYIAEIAPASKRGRLVGLFQFNIVSGILLAYLSNYLIGTMGFGADEWRWKLGIAALPAVFFFITLFGIPQSPRWLIRRGFVAEAREILKRIGEPDPDREVADIVRSVQSEDRTASNLCFSEKYRRPILLAIAIGMFNQFSGINAILYYLNEIFKKRGLRQSLKRPAGRRHRLHEPAVHHDRHERDRSPGPQETAPDRGRRHRGLPHRSGDRFRHRQRRASAGVALIGFIGFFAFSQGAVIWVYLSEVFPNLVRAKGQSLGSFTHWIMNAAIIRRLPAGRRPLAPRALRLLRRDDGLQFFVVLVFFPETAGITLEDMQKKMES